MEGFYYYIEGVDTAVLYQAVIHFHVFVAAV